MGFRGRLFGRLSTTKSGGELWLTFQGQRRDRGGLKPIGIANAAKSIRGRQRSLAVTVNTGLQTLLWGTILTVHLRLTPPSLSPPSTPMTRLGSWRSL